MNYQELIHIIENKRRFGNLPGIVISEKLLAAAGNPQKDLQFIHIAGTNGKGSAAAFLRSVLTASGIRTGLFTSPHLIDFTERIQVDGRQIPKEDVCRIGSQLLELQLDVNPTMFDYCFVMAMQYFKEQKCQIVILETGLGGRLDSTNVIDAPLVCVITKIGYDHTAVLGNTLEEIAAEKAGILKPGSCAVLEGQEPEAFKVLKERCKKLQIPYVVVQPEKIQRENSGFSYPGEGCFEMKMCGTYQQENALAAVLAARMLQTKGYPVTNETLHRGIAEAFWPGRMEVICRDPFLLIDGAHNSHGVHALAESLTDMFPGEKFHFIMGVMADKDYAEMIREILPLASSFTTVTPESSRALQGSELAALIQKQGIAAENRDSLPEAFAPFLKKTQQHKKEKTIAFGSLYFIGDVRKLFSFFTVNTQ